MLNSRKVIGIAVIAIAAVAFAIIYVYFSSTSGNEEKLVQVWWIASDPHLGHYPDHPFDSLQVAIQDVNNLGIADHAAILGDLVHNSNKYVGTFFEMMDNLNVEKWYYVTGNHDFNQSTGTNFFPIFYEGIDVCGIRFIFISTETGTVQQTGGVMNEEQFDWLQNELLTHSDQPVFIFSHQPYSSWNVWSRLAPLIQSEKNVKVWFCGHVHEWIIDENVQPYNFIEVCDSSLNWANNYNGVFMFLQREGDTVDVTIKFRNHLNHEWISVQTVDGRTIENISFSVKVS